MAKVLLISANRESMPYPVFPLGVAYVESALTRAGHETAVFDVNCHEPRDVPGALAEAVVRFAPRVIGLSVRNIDNLTYPTSVSYLGDLLILVKICRAAAPGVPIILGGSGYSLFPEEALEALDADVGLIGEGEGRIAALVQALVEQVGNLSDPTTAGPPRQVANLSHIGGVVYRTKDGIHRTRPATPGELIFPPEPPRRTGFNIGFYERQGGMGNIQTKRGCPCHCTYCTYPLLEGRSFESRPAESVAAEVEQLAAEYGVEYLYVVDNYFNYPAEHAEAVCRALIAHRLAMPWSCFVHPAHLEARLLALMREAGGASVELGTDSGSAAMLESLQKEMTPDQVLAASRACREAGMAFAHYLLLGGPGETEDTLSETFDLMDRCEPTAVIIMCGIRIYPGTPIERQAREEGLLAPGESLLEPKFYISPAVRSNLLERVADEATLRPNRIVPGLEINISPRLTRYLRDRGHKGPMWELLAQKRRMKDEG